ncbi:MAG: phasin family protein [Rhodocyclaceae bacterium]|nr:phasin family protein [Rhodocyclaceae bacterium]
MTMYTTPEQFSASAETSVEAFMTLAKSAFNGAERLAALNLNTARAALEDTIDATRALLAAKDPQALLALQSSLAQPLVEKTLAYARNVYEIATQTQEELSKVVESKAMALNKDLGDALAKAAQSAPAGSDVAVAAVKSAIAAANSAYDSMSKAAKQVAEITEANVAAATSATVKAVTPVKTVKKSA